jgi:FkbM family methyltransferase
MQLPDIADRQPFVVVDVGAAEGFQGKWSVLGPHLRVIGFEPDDRSFEALDKSDSRITYIKAALGKAGETRTLYLTSKATCTSTFPPNFAFVKNFPDAERYRLVGEEKLVVQSMDDALRAKFGALPSVDFVKMDVHGVEPDILAGAREVIASGIIGFEIECCFHPLWSGQAVFSDVERALSKLGFELYDLKNFFWRRNAQVTGQSKGQIVYCDALFFRSPEGIRDVVRMMPDRAAARAKALNGITAFLMFGYKDAAEALAIHCADYFSQHDRVQIASAMAPTFGERLQTFFLRRGKLHRLAQKLSGLTDSNVRQFVRNSGSLGNYDDPANEGRELSYRGEERGAPASGSRDPGR